MITRLFLLPLLAAMLLLGGCAGPAPYEYRYVAGKTAVLRDGYAVAPPRAPAAVHAAIAAGNRIAGMPYRYGGGHRRSIDSGYDCSGAASYVLQATGRLRGSMPSSGFRSYGERGPGIGSASTPDVITSSSWSQACGSTPAGPADRKAHAGPRRAGPADGSVVRHPAGL
jgi:hypothetical protein